MSMDSRTIKPCFVKAAIRLFLPGAPVYNVLFIVNAVGFIAAINVQFLLGTQ